MTEFLDFVSETVPRNLNSYWKDISYGKLDITGSQVFGPYTMNFAFSDLFGPNASNSRLNWIAEARRLTTQAGVDLVGFAGICAVINGRADSSAMGDHFIIAIMGSWGQKDWKWCNRCGCLTFVGGSDLGPCKAGGPHTHVGSWNYHIAHNMPNFPGEDKWRWCKKCMALFHYDVNSSANVCPAGGKHDGTSSGKYAISKTQGVLGQYDWKLCSKCGCLAYSKEGDPSVCPKDAGKHDFSGSANFTLVQDEPDFPITEFNLHYAAHEMGHCHGLMHSRGANNNDYGDPFDIMSNSGAHYDSQRWQPIGPGLNAPSSLSENRGRLGVY
jgi:hypothetical protein